MIARLWKAVLLVSLVAASACGGDDDDQADRTDQPEPGTPAEAGPQEAGTEPQGETLRILVTNDDGVAGEGMAALVAGLESLPDVEVTVVAPAENQSGTSDNTTPPEQLSLSTDVTLPGGHEAVAVPGFPADSVLYGLDEGLAQEPHVVVSGVNEGQNLGPVAFVSGTVGAARTAARRGIPALAVSQGVGTPPDYEQGVLAAMEWIEEHRDALLAGDVTTDTVANLNVPTCTAGVIRGVVEVDHVTDAAGRNVVGPSDCTSTTPEPLDELDAFANGFTTLTQVPLDAPA